MLKAQEQFQAWAMANGYNVMPRNDPASTDTYFKHETEQRWIVWQACAATHTGSAAPTDKARLIDMLHDLMRFECVLTPEGKSEMYASDTGPYVWFDHVIATIASPEPAAQPVEAACSAQVASIDEGALNEAGLEFVERAPKGSVPTALWNNLKSALRPAIELYLKRAAPATAQVAQNEQDQAHVMPSFAAPAGRRRFPEPGNSNSLADRVFNLPCNWKGDQELHGAILMGHTMACEQAYDLIMEADSAVAPERSDGAPADLLNEVADVLSISNLRDDLVERLRALATHQPTGGQ